jgi:2-polyprenyl-3-methyl-5-hydroxy-6-metoxy-1,4-benzoquinol methylase
MRREDRSKALEVVKAGYNKLGNRYASESEKFDNWAELNVFTALLPPGGRVLDVGSGTGIPAARHLTEAGFEVVGIDFSTTMVEVARQNVPKATFHEMNMIDIDLQPQSFDGVISTFALIHIPREEHAGVFKSFSSLLRPMGAMLVSAASWEWEEFDQYLGLEMFWSHFDPVKTRALIIEAGFDIEFSRDVESGGEKHHWILGRKR